MTKLPSIPAAAPPKSLWERVLNYTPVVMTVIATLLAGMSNSELSAAQYERAAGAQYQSKAADQWNFFQVKKIRGTSLDNTLDLVQTMSGAATFDAASLRASVETWPQRLQQAGPSARGAAEAAPLAASVAQALDASREVLGGLSAAPTFTPRPIASREVKAAVEAILQNKPEDQLRPLITAIDYQTWSDALRTAEDNTTAFDAATAPTSKALDAVRAPLERLLGTVNSAAREAREKGGAPSPQVSLLAAEVQAAAADFTAARLRFGARRYAMEAPLNQELALLTEIRVHQANIDAEHHRQRSRLFFVGVLIAQAAVIGATLALAMKQKSLLWTLAALAGLAALAFGIYVRLYV